MSKADEMRARMQEAIDAKVAERKREAEFGESRRERAKACGIANARKNLNTYLKQIEAAASQGLSKLEITLGDEPSSIYYSVLHSEMEEVERLLTVEGFGAKSRTDRTEIQFSDEDPGSEFSYYIVDVQW